MNFRVKVKSIPQIVKPLHGKVGHIVETIEVKPASGEIYTMLKVFLELPVDVGGGMIMQHLFMPKECFVNYEENANEISK